MESWVVNHLPLQDSTSPDSVFTSQSHILRRGIENWKSLYLRRFLTENGICCGLNAALIWYSAGVWRWRPNNESSLMSAEWVTTTLCKLCVKLWLIRDILKAFRRRASFACKCTQAPLYCGLLPAPLSSEYKAFFKDLKLEYQSKKNCSAGWRSDWIAVLTRWLHQIVRLAFYLSDSG